jgi:hypothetical protein
MKFSIITADQIPFKLRPLKIVASSIRFPRQMENHGSVFAFLAPDPSFRDVIVVLEPDSQLMLMTHGKRGQITRPFKRKL